MNNIFRNILTMVMLCVVAGILAAVFITSETYAQLVIASLFYPPIAYLIFKNINSVNPQSEQMNNTTEEGAKVSQLPEVVVDSDKRAFLKLVGAAGLSFLIYSLFSRKGEVDFMQKFSGQDSDEAKPEVGSGQQVAGPTEGYQITEIEEGEIIYSGYTNKTGGWYIMKGDTTTGTFRYVKGDRDFPKNWTDRERLHYDYFYKTFS